MSVVQMTPRTTLPEPKRDRVSIILHDVAATHGLSVGLLRGKSKISHIARARMIAYVRLRDETPLSYPAIGRVMNRDHTTIMYGERVVRARIKAGDEQWQA